MGKSGSIFNRKISVYKEYYHRDFISGTYSLANILSIMIWVIIICVPFIVVFSKDLWLKDKTYVEQPAIKFAGKFYLQTIYSDGSDQVQYDYASLKPIRDNLQNQMAPPSFQAIPVDTDRDGIVDQYNITMRIKKPSTTLKLEQSNLILAFDYQLTELVKMKMQGLAVVSVDALATPKLNAGKIIAQGQLNLRQPNAIPLTVRQRNLYDDEYFDELEHTNVEQFLLDYHTNRNETTHFKYRQNVQYVEQEQQYVDIEVIVLVPKQSIVYVPKFWEVVKFAWIKYFATFILFYIVLHENFLNYVITQGAFDCVEVSELDLKNCR